MPLTLSYLRRQVVVQAQAQLSTTTSRTASFVHNLATSAWNFSTLGAAPFRSSVTSEASTGIPRMVSCLANSTGRIIPNFLKTFTASISSSVWSSGGGYSTPEVALASQPSVVPSLPSVLDLACYSSEQSLLPRLFMVMALPRLLWVQVTLPSRPKLLMPLCQGSTLILGTYSWKMRWLCTNLANHSYC